MSSAIFFHTGLDVKELEKRLKQVVFRSCSSTKPDGPRCPVLRLAS
jgi:hypothetical protein